jgi:serine/threonine protein kinase
MVLGEGNVLKLVDLGVAKVLRGTIGKTYQGTPPYMSPEMDKCLYSESEVEMYSFDTDVWLVFIVLFD